MSAKIDRAIAKYIALRDAREALKKVYAAEIAARFTDPMDRIEAAFLKHFNDSGADNCKVTGVGIAFKATRSTYKVADREAFLSFVLKSKNLEFIDIKANKESADKYIADNNDLPPGITISTDTYVNIRRS